VYELSIRTRFAAAHCIEGYNGPCSRVHGHTWQIEATVLGPQLNRLGMLIDFQDLKRILKKIINKLDHQHLNELEPFSGGGGESPTAENLARYIFEQLKPEITAMQEDLRVGSVRVWESPDASAVYKEVQPLS
jgi:6-pyruvoyltetrahydropterin/6-carboxytetrahydropterin synthase